MTAYINRLTHLFLPGYSNNHKAKILHSESILMIVTLLVVGQFLLQVFPRVGIRVLGYAANISVDDVVRLTNQKRAEAGVLPLALNSDLAKAAKAKGDDMIAKDYWAHVAPDGTQPWYFFNMVGYKYRYAGENLAKDFSTAQSAVDAWMASPSHKENMLSDKYDDIGIAVVEGDMNGVDTTIIVQLFGRRYSEALARVPQQVAAQTVQTVQTPVNTPTPTIQITPTPTFGPTSIPIAARTYTPTKPSSPLSVLISPFKTTKGISIAAISLLMVTFALDSFLVAKRKIPRIGGRTFAHLAFLGMILAIAIIAEAGKIL
jgi:uncharacterized protein YkwD